MAIRVFITLGSNLEPEQNLRQAVRLIDGQIGVLRVSHVYRSAALGPNGLPLDQEAYLNAAVLVEMGSAAAPDQLKFRVLRPIETSLGRVRSADKYAPRPIDLDIALFGDLMIDDPEQGIRLPDPEILTRAHVALPLADLAPEHVHPITGQTLAEIAARWAGTTGIVQTTLRLR